MRPALPLALALACDPTGPAADDPCAGADPPATIAGPPALQGPCSGPVADPTRLLVTTTDFATGAAGLLDVATGRFTPDLALASTDAVPSFADGRAYVLQRYMFDALDILAPGDLRLLGQVGLEAADTPSANPHAIAVAGDRAYANPYALLVAGDRAYVTLFAAPELQVLDIADPAAVRVADRIDLCPLADADGNPEASLIVRCGETLFVSVQRLDRAHGFAPTGDHDHLAAIDRATGRLHDLDPAAAGVQPLALLGPWAKQWRLDPDDPAGHTLLVLSTGLERVDLAAGSVTWAVDPARLAPAGIAAPEQLQAFALDAAGRVWLAAYTADFAAVTLLRVDPDADDPPVRLAEDLQSVERTLEVVGDTLWFGDRTAGRAGLRAWDLTTDPPTPRFGGAPIPTGLAPYALVAVP